MAYCSKPQYILVECNIFVAGLQSMWIVATNKVLHNERMRCHFKQITKWKPRYYITWGIIIYLNYNQQRKEYRTVTPYLTSYTTVNMGQFPYRWRRDPNCQRCSFIFIRHRLWNITSNLLLCLPTSLHWEGGRSIIILMWAQPTIQPKPGCTRSGTSHIKHDRRRGKTGKCLQMKKRRRCGFTDRWCSEHVANAEILNKMGNRGAHPMNEFSAPLSNNCPSRTPVPFSHGV